MSRGQYRYKVTIQRNTPTTNDYNESVASWATLKTVNGYITFLTGREGINGKKLDTIQIMQLETWYKNVSDVTTKDRLTYDGTFYNIQSVQPFQERNYCVILAERADDNG